MAWHALTVGEVERRLVTDARGLAAGEVAVRLERHGPNRLQEERPTPAIVVFMRQFANPLILILVVAAGVTLLLGELLDTALIAIALLLNAVIGFVQERRAAGAVRALMQLVVPRSRVVRDGVEHEIDSPALVPGDLVLLEPGSRVPADLRLSLTNALKLDESLLTGESVPVAKTTHPVGDDAATADRRSIAFTGTIVTSGRGRGYVVATGHHTELGSVAGLIRAEDATQAPLHARMERFARIVGVSVLIAAIVAFVSGVALGESPSTMFHAAVAIAVSAVPEGLPIAVTVVLAIGVTRMARRQAVVRRLAAVETLGSTTVIGSDKTGTLTANRMTVQAIWVDGRVVSVPADLHAALAQSHPPSDPSALELTLLTGVLTNEARLVSDGDDVTGIGDPTEVAMLVAAKAGGIDSDEARERHRLVADVPFEPDRRYSASLRELDDGQALFVKGAPERVIAMCTTLLTEEGPVPIDVGVVHEASRALAAQGMRVLAMAYRPNPPTAAAAHRGVLSSADGDEVAPDGLVLVGLQGMMDPPREGVPEAIEACRDAGIRVVMITGDHAITARSIAAQIGIVGADDAQVLTGAELGGIDDASLRTRVSEVAVYARMSPRDKLRIVRALQDEGQTVAVTGDGVNDAPALRAAAIGVSMGRSGTDVAREASDMVLSDDNFVSIVAAVEEGRIAFANIRKVAFFLIATAFAETTAILVSVWLGWPMLLIPAQILWLNLVTNGVQDIALAFEPGSPDVLKRPPRPRREGILSGLMWERTVVTGLVMAAGALVMFNWQLEQGGSLIAAQSVALTTLVVFNAFQAGNARSENRSLFRLNPFANRFLAWSSLGALCLHVAALHLPATQFILGVEPISLEAWFYAIAIATSILVASEAHKAVRRRWPLERQD